MCICKDLCVFICYVYLCVFMCSYIISCALICISVFLYIDISIYCAERVWLAAVTAQVSQMIKKNTSAILVCRNSYFLGGQ